MSNIPTVARTCSRQSELLESRRSVLCMEINFELSREYHMYSTRAIVTEYSYGETTRAAVGETVNNRNGKHILNKQFKDYQINEKTG